MNDPKYIERIKLKQELEKITVENNALKARCSALSGGVLCKYCKFDCKDRKEECMGVQP